MKFLGAAQNVTGSRYLLEADGSRIFVDCGLYQERQFKNRNWDPFPTPPADIDAVLLTHAHLDHCGLLPKLVRDGFSGRIYCTPATAEIAKIILMDSAKLQEEDAAHKQKRHKKEGRACSHPEIPLYTIEDAENCCPHFSPVEYEQTIKIGSNIKATFYDAGHILGSSMIKVKISQNGQEKSVLFSGDIGRPDRPILHNPTIGKGADYILVESTYGDRVHQEDPEDIKNMIADVVNSTSKAGGNIIIPSFALERSQEILYYLNELLRTDAIPHLIIFLDSPMASKITEVFTHRADLFDEEMKEYISRYGSPFDMPGLKMVASSDESKAINHIKGTAIIIAGSGMCTGGRIKHHLVNNISRCESTIMFVGYQAVGTLGRQIVDGAKKVRILGQEYPVKAKVVKINGFSAHADKDELLKWLEKLKNPPKRIFVVHGEAKSAKAFGDYLRKKTGWQVTVPEYQDEIILD